MRRTMGVGNAVLVSKQWQGKLPIVCLPDVHVTSGTSFVPGRKMLAFDDRYNKGSVLPISLARRWDAGLVALIPRRPLFDLAL